MVGLTDGKSTSAQKGEVIQAEKSIGGPRQKVLITDDSKQNMETSNVLLAVMVIGGFPVFFPR